MTAIRKFATSSVLAASLAAGLGVAPASAFDHDRWTQLSIELGRMDDGEAYRRPFYGSFHTDREPACHLGHTEWVWREVCKPVGYAVNYCWHTEVAYRPVICK